MKYIALFMMAALAIVTLIGLLPEAYAGTSRCYTFGNKTTCYDGGNGVVQCYKRGNTVTCF
jgi:hypothetical protein